TPDFNDDLVMGEEFPEDIFAPEQVDSEAPLGDEPLQPEMPEEHSLPELLGSEEPLTHDFAPASDAAAEDDLLSAEEIPAMEIDYPAADSGGEPSSSTPAADSGGEPSPSTQAAGSGEIPAVIGLLACLREMTEALPQGERDIYLQGEFSKSLESVIDSLRSLTLIGDEHGS
ncbi:MAG: hypothetical protein FWC65_06110, partial [Treponema sp.]|nr:hypothetical protein [Treponema sp.]